MIKSFFICGTFYFNNRYKTQNIEYFELLTEINYCFIITVKNINIKDFIV